MGVPSLRARSFESSPGPGDSVIPCQSSLYHSQSNGKAESAVKLAEHLSKRSADPYLALLE